MGVILPVEKGRVVVTGISIAKPEGADFSSIKNRQFQHHLDQIAFDPERREFGKMHNALLHYDQYTKLPQNLFVLGDSVCQFNPVFGQGMTQALRGVRLWEQHVLGKSSSSFGVSAAVTQGYSVSLDDGDHGSLLTRRPYGLGQKSFALVGL